MSHRAQAGLEEAVRVVGGQAALARALGLSRQAVNQWLRVLGGVPPEWVDEVERVTGVRRECLRPDIFGRRNRSAA